MVDFFDDQDFIIFTDKIKKDNILEINTDKNNFKICSKCNVEMEVFSDNSIVCNTCGCIKNIITENNEYEKSSSLNYNTNNSFHMPIKCTGSGSYNYQKTIRNYTSDYNNIHKNFIIKKLNNKCFGDSKIKIPPYIIKEAINIYLKLKEEGNMDKYRATVLDGLLGILIFKVCLLYNIAITNKEIADWLNIDIGKVTKTEKILKELNIDEKLNINKLNQKQIFIKSFCSRIDIDDKYSDCLYEVLYYVEKNKIGSITSKLSTKASSLIYILSLSNKDLNIDEKTIELEFSVSISTMKAYYKNLLRFYDPINEIFMKYGMVFYKKK